MSEAPREATRPRERCPFCHEELAGSDDPWASRVDCAACSAPHHAECFVESEGCATCRGREARVVDESETVPLGVLAARLERGEAPVAIDPVAPVRNIIIIFTVVVLAILASIGVAGGTGLAILGFFAVLGVIALIATSIAASAIRRRGIRVDPTAANMEAPRSNIENLPAAWVGQADPFAAIRERIETETDGAPADPVTAPATLPSKCPSCANALEPDPDGEPIAFCYHCGAPLA